ncbi:hypothetical protein [Mycobacterium sp. AZCC_0083]|uniref:hypothetical protein n=1 Tax=Mycobacterium sp. AZCC_0083 TaxID=2735882 RepID=UPI00161CC71C|nr:hypothetical protein [Mycobacterium sp. AZCC_0083]MBB5165528.1 adenylylsulfate kinase-like enzyme [Mycobacterium sp. AZCC_0083]
MSGRSEALLVGGRSGTGKSSVGNEIHAQLSAAEVWHCLIDGDFLDLAHPSPWEHGLAERNLAAMWTNYRALAYRRMIYTNTAAVLAGVVDAHRAHIRFVEFVAAGAAQDAEGLWRKHLAAGDSELQVEPDCHSVLDLL